MVSKFDLAQTDRLLTTTRAVRKRLDLARPVPRQVIEDCLRIAIQAPTGSNAQRWHFVVVVDATKRKRLAELYRRTAEVYLTRSMAEAAAARLPGDPGYAAQMERVQSSAVYLMEHLHEVPVHVVCCLAENPQMPMTLTSGSSIYPAAWSFQLALRSRGLGTCFTTLHLQHEQEAATLLGIPAAVKQMLLMPVAYTRGEDFRPAIRRPLEEVLHWDHW